ncbi:antibiotic biosynthesis monooxygenase family protein [Bacillus sp. FJAT-45037]|uniref:antibiotic biosynthesis monooxygenase family protein n=1 Tax=Bacillus sp. FJAT-45037 TaxID=2011007 RepID=UPI000C23EE13
MSVFITNEQPTNTAYITLTSKEDTLYYTEHHEQTDGKQYSTMNENGDLPTAGFVVLNNIPVTDEGREQFEERFKNRAGLVEKEPGFKAIRILRPETDDTYIVMTIWDTEQSFKKWQESQAYSHAHKKRGTDSGLKTSIFPRPSFVTTYQVES